VLGEREKILTTMPEEIRQRKERLASLNLKIEVPYVDVAIS